MTEAEKRAKLEREQREAKRRREEEDERARRSRNDDSNTGLDLLTTMTLFGLFD